MPLKHILWDFGNTLAEETFLHVSPDDIPDWKRAWEEVLRVEWADAWQQGDMSFRNVMEKFASHLSIPVERVIEHVYHRCGFVEFYPTPLDIAKRSRLPQAMVTVNPDLFSHQVVPRYKLDEIFKPIVTSWEEHTLDKGLICLAALKKLGNSISPAEALLIDNKLENIESWAAHGGAGYHFRGEEQFQADLDSELRELGKSVVR